jgi:hypothetical protein
MKKLLIYLTISLLSGLAVWFVAVPSKHDRAIKAFEVAQVGDSQTIIRGWIGEPKFSETLNKEDSAKHHDAITGESYSFFLVRYVFYYDSSLKLRDKVYLTSE